MLSIVVASRNDNHGGCLVERTNLFIRSIAHAVSAEELETELVFVEWNPPTWSRPLVDVLEFPQESFLSAKIITVPKEINDRLAASPAMDFYQMIAKNVGIRRSNGSWILCTNPDTVYSPDVMERIAYLPEASERKFYRMPRIDVAPVHSAETEEALDRCRRNEVNRDAYQLWEHVHSWACGDFTLLHRDDWFDARGYPELEIWSIHIDSLFLLFMNRVMGMEEVWWEDLCVYHPEHPRSWTVQPKYGEEFPSLRHQLGKIPTVVDFFAMNGAKKLRFNNEDWGLRDEELSEIKVR